MDVLDFARYVGALFVTLGLLGGAYFAVRRFGLGPLAALAPAAVRPGLVAVLQTTPLDARRRLTVVRFDGRDHLILLGAQSEMLVASANEPALDGSAS